MGIVERRERGSDGCGAGRAGEGRRGPGGRRGRHWRERPRGDLSANDRRRRQARPHWSRRRNGRRILVPQQDRHVERPGQPRVSPRGLAGPHSRNDEDSLDSRREGRIDSAARRSSGVKGVQGNVAGRGGSVPDTLSDLFFRRIRGEFKPGGGLVPKVSWTARGGVVFNFGRSVVRTIGTYWNQEYDTSEIQIIVYSLCKMDGEGDR